MKSLRNKSLQEKFKIPKGVQQSIPIEAVWENGIFRVGKNKYARTYKFTDINYEVASLADKEKMFLDYSTVLNSLDSTDDCSSHQTAKNNTVGGVVCHTAVIIE